MFVRHKPTCEKDNTIKFKIKSTVLVLRVCVCLCWGIILWGKKSVMLFFYKELGSGLRPESYLYFQLFCG